MSLMPRCPTPAQSEAARRNGARSLGPRTPEGRRRAAGNNRRFGLRAGRFGLLPNEDAARFAMLARSIRDHYRPADAPEAALCRQMAEALWLAERAERLEAAVVATLRGVPPATGRRLPGLATVLRYHGRAQRTFARAARDLVILQRRPRAARAAPICTHEPEPVPAPAADRAVRSGKREAGPAATPPVPPPPSPAKAGTARTNPSGRPGRCRRRYREGAGQRLPPPRQTPCRAGRMQLGRGPPGVRNRSRTAARHW
jgi:hypothetical protein